MVDNSRCLLRFMFQPGLVRLCEGYELAQAAGIDLFEIDHSCPLAFATPVDFLLKEGLDVHALNWIVVRGYGCFLQLNKDMPPSDLITGGNCADRMLVLTRRGYEMVQVVLKMWTAGIAEVAGEATPPQITASEMQWKDHNGFAPMVYDLHKESQVEEAKSECGVFKPCWNWKARQLRVNEVVIKQYVGRAENQERVLSAFEEEGWPFHIDDPLPPAPLLDPKLRLRDTISSLNRHHSIQLVRFRGDGRGKGVRWELTLRPPKSAGGK